MKAGKGVSCRRKTWFQPWPWNKNGIDTLTVKRNQHLWEIGRDALCIYVDYIKILDNIRRLDLACVGESRYAYRLTPAVLPAVMRCSFNRRTATLRHKWVSMYVRHIYQKYFFSLFFSACLSICLFVTENLWNGYTDLTEFLLADSW